jgi:hypothetical protein
LLGKRFHNDLNEVKILEDDNNSCIMTNYQLDDMNYQLDDMNYTQSTASNSDNTLILARLQPDGSPPPSFGIPPPPSFGIPPPPSFGIPPPPSFGIPPPPSFGIPPLLLL